MNNPPSALKTYSVAIFAWISAIIPKSCEEWTALFQMIGAILAVLLVGWRLKREITHKGDKRND